MPRRPVRESGRRPERLRRLASPTAVAVVLAAATGYLAAVDPAEPGHYPGCPILAATGWYCPGCGGLRAVHELSHGHLITALSSNALVTLAIPVAVAFWARWFLTRLSPGPAKSSSRAEPGGPGVGSTESGWAESGPAESGLAETGWAESGGAGTDPVETGRAGTDWAESGLAEPAPTEPAPTEPAPVAAPVEARPTDTGVAGAGPRGTGPRGTGPRGTGPRGTGPRGTGPRGTGPRGPRPAEAQPATSVRPVPNPPGTAADPRYAPTPSMVGNPAARTPPQPPPRPQNAALVLPNGRLPGGTRVWPPIAVAFGLILFAVLRNLPGLGVLAP
ncbi:DUF2752 domain-containing protein [Kineosporia babensis]|uniref:DUF2752 domain-containing protein n=1 Tax=Kineosporia babensis TaxID=499548 RepID=UPI0038B239FB